MEGKELIEAIRRVNLTGRGGAAFPVADKWKMVADIKADKKYVVINGEEGEPATHKDYYILKHYSKEIINGIELALKIIRADEAYLFLKPTYFRQMGSNLRRIAKNKPIRLICAPGHYRCGEETMILQTIEKKRIEPRSKPPYPTVSGLWGFPTLINNIETIWAVSLINQNRYHKTRFYTISGAIKRPGVYEAVENIKIKDLLAYTKNTPKGHTFAQVDGGAAGLLVSETQYDDTEVIGCGTVVVHRLSDTPLLLKQWSAFFKQESCGRCVPCREGTIRLYDELRSPKPDPDTVNSLIQALDQTSFCGLGKGAAMPFCSGIKNQIIQLSQNVKVAQ